MDEAHLHRTLAGGEFQVPPMRLLGALLVCLALEANHLRMSVEKTAVHPGETVAVSIALETTEEITAIQWERSAAIRTQMDSIAPRISGKDLRCGEKICVLYGFNREPLSSGVVAVWTVSVPYATPRGTLVIETTSPIGADPDGNSVTITNAPPVVLEVVEDGVPEFQREGVVDSATFQPGVAPGSLATIFGRGFVAATRNIAADGTVELAGLTVSVNGISAPLLMAGYSGEMEQVNVQIPFEVLPGVADVEIRNAAGQSSRVGGIPIYPVHPRIFTGGIVHIDGPAVTPENPAKPGGLLSIYLTGGGAIAAATGIPGPIPPPALELPTRVSVDGEQGRVLFAGYAPNWIGVYQINLEIPQISGRGMRTLVVEIGSVASNPIAVPVN